MPSAQVSLVIETEKIASRIESDAQAKAQEIMDFAKLSAEANRMGIDTASVAAIEKINMDARTKAGELQNKSDLHTTGLLSALQLTAEQNKQKAILSAVHVLSGRT